MKKLYVLVEPKDVNGRLAILDGKILAHLPNYLECFVTPPPNTDATKQVFAIFPADQEVHVVNDGGRKVTYLWKGPKESRALLGDLVSVPILPLDVSAGVASATDVAKAAFADFPEPVRLAGVIASADPSLLASLPASTAQLNDWAAGVLRQFSSPAAAAGAG